MAYTYFVTIKNTSVKYTSMRDIIHIWTQCMFTGAGVWSSKYCFELDSLFRLHMHTVACFDTPPHFKKFQTKNWHIHFRRIKDSSYMSQLDAVFKYMYKVNKNIYEYEQKETESYFHYHYGFDLEYY